MKQTVPTGILKLTGMSAYSMILCRQFVTACSIHSAILFSGLYDDPVVWSQKSQITGDTILLYTKNKKADRMEAFENGFMVNELDPDVYNQIKSSRMDAWFLDGAIDSVRAIGLAECIYYLQDEDSAYTGVNQSTCDIIDIYFAEQRIGKSCFSQRGDRHDMAHPAKRPGRNAVAQFQMAGRATAQKQNMRCIE